MTSTLDASDARDELVVLEIGCVPAVDYSDKPQEWLEYALAEYAWGQQRDIWRSVADNRSTAVLSCNNSGKTWLAARIVVWWVLTHWREGVRVVTTAPTAAQVTLLLWQEIRDAFNRARLLHGQTVSPGRIIGSPYPQWKIGDKSVAFGRKPADHEQSAMQGVHARYVLVVVDEAGGVSQSIFSALNKVLTNENARVLAIGNPDDKNAPFGRITEPGSGWNIIHIDGLRTPNFTREMIIGDDPDHPNYPLTAALMRHEGIPFSTEAVPEKLREFLLHPLYVEERFTHYCGIQPSIIDLMTPADLGQHVADAAAASQLFMAEVRGDYSEVAGTSVIPLGWVRRAVERTKDWEYGDKRRGIPPRAEPVGRRILGVDVATANGADDTVIAPRQGHVSFPLHIYPEGDTLDTVGHVQEHVGPVPQQAVAVVDGIGIGAGVRDVLRGQTSIATVSFDAYNQSDRRDRYGEHGFINDRAAAWWRMRELLDPAHGSDICLPDDPILVAELTAPTWKMTSTSKGGRIQIESKDDIRKRLKHSTDRADAVIQSYWVDGAPVNAAKSDGGAIPYGGGQAVAIAGVRKEGALTSPRGGGGVIPYALPNMDDDE